MLKGLDISSYQKGISMTAIKNAGMKFLILRAGFTGWGTGVSYNKDSCFETFYKQAKAKGIGVGAYWYSCANTKEKGINEAKYMYENCLKGKQFEYPIYIDVEEVRWQSNNKKGVTDAIIGFCEYLEDKGYWVGIYASDISGFKDKMDVSRLKAYDKWVARYGSKPAYVKTYGMWQSSSTGRIKGYVGNLDTNEAYTNYPTVIKNKGKNGFAKQTTTKKGTLIVNSGSWNVRKGAGINYAVVKVVKGGTKLNYYGISNSWYKVDGGYISPKAVKKI